MRRAKIPLSQIKPPRETLRNPAVQEVTFEELCDSIRVIGGLLNPLTVCESGDGYELVAGNRRYNAVQELRLIEVDCTVFPPLDDYQFRLIQLAENAHQLPTTTEDYRKAMVRLLRTKPDATVNQLARELNKDPRWIVDRLFLLDLEDEVRALVERGVIKAMNAYQLSKITPALREGFVSHAITMSGKAFQELTNPVIKEFQEAKQRGQILTTEQMVKLCKPVPNLRSLSEALREYEKREELPLVIARANCKTLLDAAYATVEWFLRINHSAIETYQAAVADALVAAEVTDALRIIDEESAQ